MVNVYFEYSANNNPEKCENLLCDTKKMYKWKYLLKWLILCGWSVGFDAIKLVNAIDY